MSVSEDVFIPSLKRASFTERHSLFELSPFAHGDTPCDPRLPNCTFFEIFLKLSMLQVLPPISCFIPLDGHRYYFKRESVAK